MMSSINCKGALQVSRASFCKFVLQAQVEPSLSQNSRSQVNVPAGHALLRQQQPFVALPRGASQIVVWDAKFIYQKKLMALF